jgi:hypothetical protein
MVSERRSVLDCQLGSLSCGSILLCLELCVRL